MTQLGLQQHRPANVSASPWPDSGINGRPYVHPNLLTSRCSKLVVEKRGQGRQAPQVMKWRKRLPTIPEVDCDHLGEATSPPSALLSYGLPESIADPAALADSASIADIVVKALRDGSKSDRRSISAWLWPALPTLALSESGSSITKAVLESTTGSDRRMIVSSFQGTVLRLCMSPHGHEVLVTMLGTMPVSEMVFMAFEMAGHGRDIARSRFGSRVLETMAMHCSKEQVGPLAMELAEETVDLSRHPHGSSVIHHLLEYAPEECKSDIVKRLLPDIASHAMDRVASHVVEKALEYCDLYDVHLIAATLLLAAKPISLEDIACSRRGSCILSEIASASLCIPEFRLRLSGSCTRLAHCKFGRKVIKCFDVRPPSCADAVPSGAGYLASMAA